MSKTYKDQRRYDYYEWLSNHEYHNETGGPAAKDINEPDSLKLSKFYTSSSCAQYYYKWANRKYRRANRKKLRQGDYDNFDKKPINVDWMID